MDNFKIASDFQLKIKKYDKYILSNKTKKISDNDLTVYIIENELIPYSCNKCKKEPIWMNKPLQLVLDRMNNIITDNRLENLRFLCPNCFSQLKKRTILFKRITKDKQTYCIDCNTKIKYKSIRIDSLKSRTFRCKACIEKAINSSENI